MTYDKKGGKWVFSFPKFHTNYWRILEIFIEILNEMG